MVVTSSALLWATGTGAVGQASLLNPLAFAKAQFHLSDVEVATLHRGETVSKTLASTVKREVATAGGVRIHGSAAQFIARYRTLDGFRTSSFVLQIGKFSDTPRLEDLDSLTVDNDDIEALRKCSVASCRLRLPADDIRRANRDVDWKSPGAAVQAAALYKTLLLEHVIAYRAGGRATLTQYDDGGSSLRLADETAELFGVSPSLLDGAPAFCDYLRQYPHLSLAKTEDFFYWSKEVFGFKPVVGLNHVSIFTTGPESDAIIVTTQIYASHYMDGSIAITALMADPEDSHGFYWLYLNRSRIDRLSGLMGLISRPIVQSKARAGLAKSLLQTKQRTEAGK